ncbi:hypothetical protein LTR62_006519 [Meristemomyces frigidus]|uniref:Carboxylic ester hydrolase n=1 Tax=Meristemomyces frigidus TaxID=1508187 RepID=A0AAN7TG52_9PEZI|nr:hypothetical protein LTR62_006519 [Meristemomyces frigidus]
MVRPHTILALAALESIVTAAPTTSPTYVRASTGYYQGLIDANFTNVREFLSVPYGMSTAGSNRFMPPVAVPMSSKSFNSTAYPPACPQYVSAIPSIWNQQIPQYLQYWGAPNNSAGISAPFANEDCLKLAIWTPANATAGSNLPVALFWTGGGFQTNGILVPGQLPQRWVSLSQSHIVVTINYRMNIMGFPNAAGAYDNNLGLMDQRLSLEWVRDNIPYFGGDSSKIMIWGQSAGAGSVDLHNYAFWENPIAHAIFAESGNAVQGSPWRDNSNFTFVAQNVGCDFPNNASQELACMQQVDYNKIINFMGQYQDNSTLVNPTQPSITFSTVADERLVFHNNTVRYEEGFVSKIPIIYSGVANEGGSLQPYPVHDPYNGTNQSLANSITESLSLCTGATSTSLRHSIGLPTFRYQYAGNWSNQDPLPWMGAFHSSDLVMLFGAYTDGEGPCCEPLEAETSKTMGEYILAFMKDPWNGPQTKGWYPMDPTLPDGGTMLRFGANGKAVQNVTGFEVEAVCFGTGPYNPFP